MEPTDHIEKIGVPAWATQAWRRVCEYPALSDGARAVGEVCLGWFEPPRPVLARAAASRRRG